MAIDIQDLLLKVNRPSRYIGNEINAVKKDYSRIELSIALAFPDVYVLRAHYVIPCQAFTSGSQASSVD